MAAPQPTSTTIHDQDTLTAAIANFKPTPKEVISGIAPHVFDDRRIRRRRNSTGRPRRRPSMVFACEMRPRSSVETPSPLRISAIITVEELQSVEDTRLGALYLLHYSCCLTNIPTAELGQKTGGSNEFGRETPETLDKARKAKRTFSIRITSLRFVSSLSCRCPVNRSSPSRSLATKFRSALPLFIIHSSFTHSPLRIQTTTPLDFAHLFMFPSSGRTVHIIHHLQYFVLFSRESSIHIVASDSIRPTFVYVYRQPLN